MTPAFILALALIGISFGGPLVRLSHAHPLAIAIWRVGFSLTIIAIALVVSGGWRQWRRLDRHALAIAFGSGAMLAVHFWAWNTSVGYTSVASSVVLVDMQPVIVGLLSVTVLHEPPTARQWFGIVIGVIGAAVVASPALESSTPANGRALFGDGLAIVGAIAGSFYFIGGRRLRMTLDVWPYVGLVYGSCFVVLLLLALVARAPVAPQPPRELAIFAGLAIGPMLLGHTGFNWALKFMRAYVVNLALLGEPIGATILAALLPGIRELPNVFTLVGGALIFAGIFAAARASSGQATIEATQTRAVSD